VERQNELKMVPLEMINEEDEISYEKKKEEKALKTEQEYMQTLLPDPYEK
jgi:hypothetical protein